MLELAFTRATSASWLLKQPDKQEQAKRCLLDGINKVADAWRFRRLESAVKRKVKGCFNS